MDGALLVKDLIGKFLQDVWFPLHHSLTQFFRIHRNSFRSAWSYVVSSIVQWLLTFWLSGEGSKSLLKKFISPQLFCTPKMSLIATAIVMINTQNCCETSKTNFLVGWEMMEFSFHLQLCPLKCRLWALYSAFEFMIACNMHIWIESSLACWRWLQTGLRPFHTFYYLALSKIAIPRSCKYHMVLYAPLEWFFWCLK